MIVGESTVHTPDSAPCRCPWAAPQQMPSSMPPPSCATLCGGSWAGGTYSGGWTHPPTRCTSLRGGSSGWVSGGGGRWTLLCCAVLRWAALPWRWGGCSGNAPPAIMRSPVQLSCVAHRVVVAVVVVVGGGVGLPWLAGGPVRICGIWAGCARGEQHSQQQRRQPGTEQQEAGSEVSGCAGSAGSWALRAALEQHSQCVCLASASTRFCLSTETLPRVQVV